MSENFIAKPKLDEALCQMGKRYLMPEYREKWTAERPTTGYCYVVAEVLCHYLAPKGSQPYKMKTAEDTTH